MKLIDLMVKENVQWPEGAEFAAQDSDKDLDFYADRPVFYEATWDVGAIARHVMTIRLHAIADDYNLSIVTKHEYEQAQVKAAYDKTVGACATFTVDSEDDALDAEIERALDAADAYYADETLAVINEHLRELYAMKRERLRGELESKDTVTICATEYAELLRNKVDSELQLNITDWRDLREGDVIEVSGDNENLPRGYRGRFVGRAINDDRSIGIIGDMGEITHISDWQFISRPS